MKGKWAMKIKNEDAVAHAIQDTFGQGDAAYGGNIVDAIYAGLKMVANSVSGCEYSCDDHQDVDGHSLCQSIDKLASAMNRIADVLAKESRAELETSALPQADGDCEGYPSQARSYGHEEVV
jgi:hypothetical protein